jgi:hypothetical protein
MKKFKVIGIIKIHIEETVDAIDKKEAIWQAFMDASQYFWEDSIKDLKAEEIEE